MLRAGRCKIKTLKIKLALFPGYMHILLSVRFPEALCKLLQFGVRNQNVSFLVSSAVFFSTFHFYYIIRTLPKDTQVFSVDPVRTGTIIYIFHSHRMIESVDSVRVWEVPLDIVWCVPPVQSRAS